jgi:hypothetical protein
MWQTSEHTVGLGIRRTGSYVHDIEISFTRHSPRHISHHNPTTVVMMCS